MSIDEEQYYNYLRSLIRDAALAEDVFDLDELELYADSLRTSEEDIDNNEMVY